MDQAAVLDPENPKLWFGKAQLLEALGRSADARPAADRGRELED